MPERDLETPTLSLEAFASINAALETGLPRDEILAEAGISPAAWEAAQERWLATLAGEAAQGRLRPSKRYLELAVASKPIAAARARAARRKPAGPLPVTPAPAVVPVVGVEAERAVATSAMLEAQRPAARPQAPFTRVAEEDGTAMISLAALTQKAKALPFAGREDDTEDYEPETPRALGADAALPFARPMAAATIPPPPAPRDGALPFATGAPRESSLPAEPSAIRETWGLPFQRAAAAPQVAPPPQASAPPPPAPPAPAAHAQLTLAEYAHLCAGVRTHPMHVAWIQSQYQLTPERWTALHAVWQQLFLRDPALKAEWQRLIAERMPYWQRGQRG